MGIFSFLKKKNKSVSEQIAEKKDSQDLIKQEKFDKGLNKSANFFSSALDNIAKKYTTINDEIVETIEEFLLSFDIGYSTTKKILTSIVDELKIQKITDKELIPQIIIDKLFTYYIQDSELNIDINITKDKLNVVLVCGVNGVGKTTSIAKLANYYLQKQLKVCLIAADTFRAGAIEQLKAWAEKLNIKIFTPQKEGQDPASVVFEGVKYAKENNIDLVFCDTSGRLQNKVNLMNELKKINNIIKKFDETQPCETLLVIDATTGLNGLKQTQAFNEVTTLSGIILTKMDSTAKGGIALSIKDVFNIPIKFIGLGEGINDISIFDLEMYLESLTKNIKL